MGLPSNLPRRYTPSRQLISGDDVNAFSDSIFSYQLLTALGVAQGDAALVNAANVEVAAGSANNAGIKLPLAVPGTEVLVLNNSANTTIVYASAAERIQNAAATYAAAAAGVNMATLTSAKYRCVKKGFWQRIATA